MQSLRTPVFLSASLSVCLRRPQPSSICCLSCLLSPPPPLPSLPSRRCTAALSSISIVRGPAPAVPPAAPASAEAQSADQVAGARSSTAGGGLRAVLADLRPRFAYRVFFKLLERTQVSEWGCWCYVAGAGYSTHICVAIRVSAYSCVLLLSAGCLPLAFLCRSAHPRNPLASACTLRGTPP